MLLLLNIILLVEHAKMTVSQDKILHLYSKVQVKYQFPEVLKEEQLETLQSLMNGEDTLAVLPTGYGKSLIYILLPLLYDEVGFILLFVLYQYSNVNN